MPWKVPTYKPPGHDAAKKEASSEKNRARGSAASRGYGHRWQKLRMMALRRDCYICQVCGLPVGKGGHVDHIVPLAQGGTNSLDNLQTLCATCHSRKTAQQDGGFGNKKTPS